MTPHVTLPADVQQVDETGYVWTLLEEAAIPGDVIPGRVVVIPGRVVVAGAPQEPLLARVVDIVERSGRQVVHLEVLSAQSTS